MIYVQKVEGMLIRTWYLDRSWSNVVSEECFMIKLDAVTEKPSGVFQWHCHIHILYSDLIKMELPSNGDME